MAVSVHVGDETIDVRFTGIDRLLALAGTVHLPLDEVTSVRVARVEEVRPELGWRVGGSHLPGYLTTGWFTVPGAKKSRQLWSVYRDPEVLVIETTRRKPTRLVLQLPDRHEQAWYVGERLAARRGGDEPSPAS